LLNLLIVVP